MIVVVPAGKLPTDEPRKWAAISVVCVEQREPEAKRRCRNSDPTRVWRLSGADMRKRMTKSGLKRSCPA